MEIKIEVPEEKFKDVLQEELNAFTKDELHNICIEGLYKILSNPEQLKTLFKKDGYYNDGSYELQQMLRSAANKIDLSELYDSLKNQMIKYIRDNHEKLIKDILLDIFVSGLSQNVYNNSLFRSELSRELAQMNYDIQQCVDNQYVRKQ